jgi:hypothetical protein
MLMSHAEMAAQPGERRSAEPRDLYLILFPSTLQDRVITILEAVGVPGYSETADVIGRGPRGRHFNNPIWPGATGEIFTAVGSEQGQVLMQSLQALDRELERDSRGLYGLHVLSWPCQMLL